MSQKRFFKNKDNRVFPATEHLIRNQTKLGLIECNAEGKVAYAQDDEIAKLKAQLEELQAKQADMHKDDPTANQGEQDADGEKVETNDNTDDVDLDNLTPQQKAALTRAKNRENKQ